MADETNTGGGASIGGNASASGGGDVVGRDKIQINRTAAKHLAEIHRRLEHLEEDSAERARVQAELRNSQMRQEDKTDASMRRLEDLLDAVRADQRQSRQNQDSQPPNYLQVLQLVMAFILVLFMLVFIFLLLRVSGSLPTGLMFWPW